MFVLRGPDRARGMAARAATKPFLLNYRLLKGNPIGRADGGEPCPEERRENAFPVGESD